MKLGLVIVECTLCYCLVLCTHHVLPTILVCNSSLHPVLQSLVWLLCFTITYLQLLLANSSLGPPVHPFPPQKNLVCNRLNTNPYYYCPLFCLTLTYLQLPYIQQQFPPVFLKTVTYTLHYHFHLPCVCSLTLTLTLLLGTATSHSVCVCYLFPFPP
jgi:hypothetical protein